jgi:hypothetical protein
VSHTVLGTEDVLDGDPPPEPPEFPDPEDRTSFRHGTDVALAVLITVAALVVGFVVWQSSEVKHTSLQTNPAPMVTPDAPTVFPPSLGEAWSAPSSATPIPVVAGPAVITGEGGEVAGRDPLTGEVRWRYSRNLPLCTITSAWSLAVAVYRTDGKFLPSGDPRSGGGCSEALSLDPASGRRGRQLKPGEQVEHPNDEARHSNAELGTQLLFDGVYLTTTGRHLLTTWRNDLVQTMEYGTVPAIVNSGKQPRTGCTYGSVQVTLNKVGVIERCEGDPADRLTVYGTTNNDANGNNRADEPAPAFSVVVGGRGARVVAMTDKRTAVVLPDPSRLVLFDETGKQVNEYNLDLPPTDLRGDPPGLTVPTFTGRAAVYWYTGTHTVALSPLDLHPLWTTQGTLGPGTVFAGRAMIPVRNGIRVLDQVTGALVGTIAVNRGRYTGMVTMSTLGPMLLEQRGGNLVALR